MRRRLFELCLRAYPRTYRERDGDYLRDLALDLSESRGTIREAAALLLGGCVIRRAARQRASRGRSWLRIAAVVVVGIGLTAGLLGSPVFGEQQRVESDQFVCASPTDGCAAVAALVADRRRDGWHCQQRAADASPAREWQCTLR